MSEGKVISVEWQKIK